MAREKIGMAELANPISLETGFDEEQIRTVITSLCNHIGKALNRRADVVMLHVGSFKVREDAMGFPDIIFVPTLKMTTHLTVRSDMNKFGVVLDNNKAAMAKLTGKCPDCQTDLEERNPPKCPICGTAPFEPQTDK